MNINSTSTVANTHNLNEVMPFLETNRILLHSPQNVYDALKLLEGEMPYFSLAKTALLRTVVPEWGGAETPMGKHVSSGAVELLRSVSIEKLKHALQLQEKYFARVEVSSTTQRRHRHYLKQLIAEMRSRGWIQSEGNEDDQPRFNLINSPPGQHRIYAHQVRTTTLKQSKPYALGQFKEDYVEIEDEEGDKHKVLANPILEQQIHTITLYVQKMRKNGNTSSLKWLYRILGFLHRIKGIPLSELTLDCFIPFIQLRFSEADFESHEDFRTNGRGQFLDPEKVEQKLAMAEAVARRRAKKAAEPTWAVLEEFLNWRDQEFAAQGKLEGVENSTKQYILSVSIACAAALYEHETDFKKPKRVQGMRRQSLGYGDIPVIVLLRTKYDSYPIDAEKVKKRINQTRCIFWLKAIQIFEKQRLIALSYYLDARAPQCKSGFTRRPRKLSGIATEFQKAVILALMLFIPTDRQQTYRNLLFGTSFKNGRFLDDDFEEFEDWGIPSNPDKAQFWINLEDFKTVEKYGEFWYPVPNVQFSDGTTFYELICAWLWGFEDQDGHWPTRYLNEDQHWQGYIDEQGNRAGWRAALESQHDYVFTMPEAKRPFNELGFCNLIRSIFIHFTQEEGKPIPVTPHSFRHMLSNYLDRLEINDEEEKSFSYVLHHSPEMRRGNYVYRDNMIKIGPAVRRMNQIINDIVL